MELCNCNTRSGIIFSNGSLLHSSCGKPVRCACGSGAVNIGAIGPECRECSPIFSEQFFDDAFDLERGFFDSFVYFAGGLRVTEMISGPPKFNNADYYFEQDNVIVELKTLKTEFAATSQHVQKFEQLVAEWLSDGRLEPESVAGLKPLPEAFVFEHMALLRKQLESITKKANKQIRQTKAALRLDDSQGLLLLMNDGFYQANPNLTRGLFGDPLQRQMRSIDGFVLFNLRKKLQIPGDEVPRLFWVPTYRESENVKLSDFVNGLGATWFRYLQQLSGIPFKSSVESHDPEYKELTDAAYL